MSLFCLIASVLDEEQLTWKDELLLVFEITGSYRMRKRQSVSAKYIMNGASVSSASIHVGCLMHSVIHLLTMLMKTN